jgi:hypothetical protein
MRRDAITTDDGQEGYMAMLTLVEAARKTGLITLARAIKSGRLSVNRKEDGSYEIDPAELARLYPFAASRAVTGELDANSPSSGLAGVPSCSGLVGCSSLTAVSASLSSMDMRLDAWSAVRIVAGPR